MSFPKVFAALAAVIVCSSLWAGSVFKYDFEKGNGGKLPKYASHIKGRDEGGTITIVNDAVGPYKKALKATVEKGKPDARCLIRRGVQASTGDTLIIEAYVKGKGSAVFGLYGYNRKGVMTAYMAVGEKVNSDKWRKMTKEILLKKKGITYCYPFLQANGGTAYFSGITIRKKGVIVGKWEYQKKTIAASWKKEQGKGIFSVVNGGKKNARLVMDGAKGSLSIASALQKGESGDLVIVSLKARGKGVLSGGLFLAGSGKGQKQLLPVKKFTLTKDWKELSFTAYVKNGAKFAVKNIQTSFSLPKGSAELENIFIFQKAGDYKGDLPFPKKAVVFPLMDPKFQPKAAELKKVPAVLNGVKGRSGNLFASTLDLAPLMNGVKMRNCAWVYFTLNSPIEADYTIGAGADWWMTLYHNGKKIIDTMATGNRLLNCDILDYTRTIRLKKGANIFAVKFLSGKNASFLRVGGPLEMLRYKANLQRARELAAERFDAPGKKFAGNPALKEMITKLGDMTRTKVAVYSKNGSYAPFKQSFSFSKLQKGELFGQSILLVDFPLAKKEKSKLNLDFFAGKDKFQLTIENHNENALACYFSENGKRSSLRYLIFKARELLPGDFSIYMDRNGYVTLLFSSTKNTSMESVFRWESSLVKKLMQKPFKTSFSLSLAGKKKILLDDYAIVTGKVKEENYRIPFLLELDETFDPVKAGWKLVMSDDFNGKTLNKDLWHYTGRPPYDNIRLENGKLILTTKWNDKKTAIRAGGIWTKRVFTYGYYEARLRFTRQPGTWSAFWMMSNGTPVSPAYSVEFDFYEDYYTRPLTPGGPYRKTLDCTAYAGWKNGHKRPIKVWNYQAELPGTLDEFYTYGVKWTPFEISYYHNGKKMKGSLKFSPYDTVTWDAFNHCALTAPSRMILSNQTGLGNPKNGKYPEDFVVDYFRAYEYPRDKDPIVKWGRCTENLFVKEGDKLFLSVEAKPGKTKSPIRGAYLFDNGYFIAYKDAPPYNFTIPMTKEFYDTTQWAVPGLSKGTPMAPPLFNTPFPHSFMVFVQDENGKVAQTSLKKYVLDSGKKTRPYKGKAQVIPGTVQLNLFDEGGQDHAYYWSSPGGRDQSFRMDEKVYAGKTMIESNDPGNWAKYTVDVKETGKYDATLFYSCPWKEKNARGSVEMYVDGKKAGTFTIIPCGKWDPAKYKAHIKNIPITKGRHVITLMFFASGFNAKVEFAPSK